MIKNKDVLILEIKEQDGVVAEYQRILYEASLLGIKRVKFMCVWAPDGTRGTEIFPKLLKTCDLLRIKPLNSITGYNDCLYDGPMIGKLGENNNVSLIQDLVSFESLKQKNSNKLENKERIGKVLAKHISYLV